MTSTGPIPLPTVGPNRRQETSALLASTVLRNVAQIVIIWLLATLTNPETVGRYALVLAIATPVFVVAQLGIRGIYLTHAQPIALRSYVLVQLAFLLAAGIITISAAAVFNPSLVLLALFVSGAKASDALAEPFSGVAQRFHRTSLVLVCSTLVAVVGSGALALTLILTSSLELATLAFAVISLLSTAIALAVPATRIARTRESNQAMLSLAGSWRFILAAGLPLGVSTGLLQLITSAPQYVLDQTMGAADVGRLAVLIYAYAVADLVAGTLSIAWIPHAQDDLRQRRGRRMPITGITLRAISRWSLIYIPLTVVGLAFVWFAYPFVFGEAYALTLDAAIPLGIAVLLLPAANFSTAATIVSNQYAHSLAFSIAAAVAGIGAALLLVPIAGIAGAIWAMAIGNAVRAIAAFLIVAFGESREARRRIVPESGS
ncbi:MAG TPA: hypothetical protein VNQ52_00665 [Microbacteriaceae bacterium]|nr:hypothetical protein [Microbacteriaceae bacterium]